MNNIEEQKPKRPQLLSILCIFTFIGSGMGVLGFSAMVFSYEASMEALKAFYGNMPEASFMLDAPKDFFIIAFLLMAASVAGALFMWNLRKVGFHLYTISQILYLILPFIYFRGETNPMLNIIFTALFVYLYARNLQYMR